MDAILPFVAGAAAPAWDTPKGRAGLSEVMRRILTCGQIDTVRVVTDRPDLFAGMTGVQVCAPEGGVKTAAPGALPPGTAWAMEALAARGLLTSGPVLVADPHNPFLTAEVLEGALARFSAAGLPLVLGAARPEDHPCQFAALSTVVDAGLLLFLEDRPEALPWLPQGWQGKVAVTRPLIFDWEILGSRPAPSFHAAGPGGLPERNAPALPPGPPPGAPVWVRLGSATARLVLPVGALATLTGLLPADLRQAPAKRFVGGNFLRRPGQALLAAWTDDVADTLQVACCRVGDLPSPALLRLTPFSPPESAPARSMTLSLPGPGKAGQAHWRPTEDAGFVYTLLEQDNEQLLSCPQPFIPENGLWHHDPWRGVRVNTATGKPIMGRQNFPDLLRLDGSLAVARPGDLLRAAELLREGQVALHLLEHEWSFQDDRLAIALLDVAVRHARHRGQPCP
jgi:hypothetical protein